MKAQKSLERQELERLWAETPKHRTLPRTAQTARYVTTGDDLLHREASRDRRHAGLR